MDPGNDFTRFDREWPEFLNEVRTALPGVQILFGFLLTAPFSANFPKLTHQLKQVYFVCFLCTAAACVFLVTPSVYHRLHWRRDVRDKEEMIRTCNRLVITGIALLAIAMVAAVWIIASLIAGPTIAIFAGVTAALTLGGLWLCLPLLRRRRDLKQP